MVYSTSRAQTVNTNSMYIPPAMYCVNTQPQSVTLSVATAVPGEPALACSMYLVLYT